MKKVYLIITAVLGVGGLALLVLGLVERSGAYKMADMNKGRLDQALTAWEEAEGTPEEARLKEEAAKFTDYYASDMESGALRAGRGTRMMLFGILAVGLSVIPFVLQRKLAASPPTS